jgi:tetratricopeptide (TPR) repeat protein
VNWDEHAEREENRYQDGLHRLPEAPDARQKQLVRIAMAASGAGLARLMQGRRAEAVGWFVRSAERYRESYADAPPGSWGRLIGAVKARILAGDWPGAEADARWVLDQVPADTASPIARYALALALLVLGDDERAQAETRRLLEASEDEFPRAVAEGLAALATREGGRYAAALGRVLASFEERDAYLEDIPVADTVVVIEALAARRAFAVRPRSALLPS